jgi:serine/threonine protein kinase
LEEKPYGFEADIWSIGVVYYQLLYGKYPYHGLNDYQILKKIKTSRPDFYGVNLSDKARDFIDRCLTVNPKNRISWKEIYGLPLINETEKMIYGLTSKLRVNDNRNFYEREVKIDEELIYAERNVYKKKEVEPVEVEKEQKSIDLEKLMKQN